MHFKRSSLSHSAPDQGLSGHLLLAHPDLKDHFFAKTVIFLIQHAVEDGAKGIILNKPIMKTLSQVQSRYTYSPLAKIPVYEGGPLQTDEYLLAGWQKTRELGFMKFYFGLADHAAEGLVSSYAYTHVHCYQGIAAWAVGQLENEILKSDWLIMPVVPQLIQIQPESLWTELLKMLDPGMTLQKNVPQNLEWN